jgi:hypothetical protein
VLPPACVGDCDGDQSVSINELIMAINLALDAAMPPCAAADDNGDGVIGVEELVLAVRNALDGCASAGSGQSRARTNRP